VSTGLANPGPRAPSSRVKKLIVGLTTLHRKKNSVMKSQRCLGDELELSKSNWRQKTEFEGYKERYLKHTEFILY
jgi:hypothetical protein